MIVFIFRFVIADKIWIAFRLSVFLLMEFIRRANPKAVVIMRAENFDEAIELYKKGEISLEQIVEKMCHNPARIFDVKNRGFIRKGYFADLVLVDMNKSYTVNKDNILYKCKWSPFEGNTFNSVVTHTFVNGKLVFENGKIDESVRGVALEFERRS